MLGRFKLVPIPEAFYSSETGAPFQTCIDCGQSLLGGETQYLIEKAVRRFRPFESRDVVFEYALCLDCYEQVHAALSEESCARIEAFFAEHVDVGERARMLLHHLEGDVETDTWPWLDHCVVTGKPVDELDEYQLVCHCMGASAVLTHVPCLISGAAIDHLAALLSSETLDELGRFRDRITDLPPELAPLDHSPLLF